MYIRKLRVRNLKLLRDFELSFTTADGKPQMWTGIVGENGLCKTSVLQAIALAASGPDRANQLAGDVLPSLPDRRHRDEKLEIEASFEFSPDKHRFRQYPGVGGKPQLPPRFLSSALRLEPRWKVFQGQSAYIDVGFHLRRNLGIRGAPDPDPLREARALGLPRWFVAGYGVTRRLPKPLSSSRPEDPTVSRLDSLFDRASILGTGFADILLEILPKPQVYADTVREALIKKGDLLPRVGDLELRGHGGVRSATDLVEAHRFKVRSGPTDLKLPATWLSHGYQGLISWVADLIGQIFLEAEQPVDLDAMGGLVLIDEIDLHLHPTWQAELVPKLKKVFPNIQFVVTTHSPMVLPGLAKNEIVRLAQNAQGDVIVHKAEESPALMTGSELYEEFFGIDRLYPNELGEALQTYGRLANDPDRTEEEELQLHALREKLRAADVEPAWQPVARTAPKRKARRVSAGRRG